MARQVEEPASPYGEGPWQNVRYRYVESELDAWLRERLGDDLPLFAGGATYGDDGYRYFPDSEDQ